MSDTAKYNDAYSASTDTTTFATDGTEVTAETRKTLNALATSSIVKSEDIDKASGSMAGVDDHAMKLPNLAEP